jgi:chromosomal replication initiator protein
MSFFHIFLIYLHQNGKQVILTSDKAPVDMQDIEQRLLSRSNGIYQPNYTNQIMKRVSILK